MRTTPAGCLWYMSAVLVPIRELGTNILKNCQPDGDHIFILTGSTTNSMTGLLIPQELMGPLNRQLENCKNLIAALDAGNGELTRDILADCVMTDFHLLRIVFDGDYLTQGSIQFVAKDVEYRAKVKEVSKTA